MTFRKVCLLSFFTLFMVGQGQTPDELYQYAMILNEEFHEGPSIITKEPRTIMTSDDEDEMTKMAHTSNLIRRRAQASPLKPLSCYPLSPRNTYVPCNDENDEQGITNGFCQESPNITCAEDIGNYDCTCSEGGGGGSSNETSCPYCQLQTANAIVCQVTGSSTTFVDPSFSLMTCTCNYMGNGYLVQICYPVTDRPTNAPQRMTTTDSISPHPS